VREFSQPNHYLLFTDVRVALEWRIMKTRLFSWLGKEFVEIVGEGKSGMPADRAADDLFRQFEAELKVYGLSLDNTARLRVWGRDKDARTLATTARSKILTGKRRAASSSFISREWFDSEATAGLELLAMRPINSGAERRPVDFKPARNYLCYLQYDSVVFYSGYTSTADTLHDQVTEVLKAISGARAISGGLTQDFRKTGRLSVFLHRSQSLSVVKDLLAKEIWIDLANVEYRRVDGFAGEKYLLEIEATAAIR
jgi:hypothetical protein